jgi:hypothetical protein
MSNKISSIFDRDEFKHLRKAWDARRRELKARAAYYDGTVYRQMQALFGPLWPKLYRGVKPLFLPFSRAVNVDAGIIPGGWALPEDAPAIWTAARDRVFRDSHWDAKGVLWVHYGAQYGISMLKVVDDRAARRVRLQPVDPLRVMLVGRSVYDAGAEMSVYVDKRRTPLRGSPGATKRPARKQNALAEYAEVTTATQVRTFVDGAPMGVGGREAVYANDLGVVPYVQNPHIDDGTALGECTYARAIEMLDEVNELASYLADIIKKHAEPQWAISGAEPSELEKSGDNAWFLPQDGDAKALVAKVDIEGVLNFVKLVRDNVHEALPETSFTELRKRERVATATLELQMLELTLKIQRARPNYDAALAKALRLAGQAGQQMGIPGLAVLDSEDLQLDNERRVLPLDPEVALRLESLALSIESQRKAIALQDELGDDRSRE